MPQSVKEDSNPARYASLRNTRVSPVEKKKDDLVYLFKQTPNIPLSTLAAIVLACMSIPNAEQRVGSVVHSVVHHNRPLRSCDTMLTSTDSKRPILMYGLIYAIQRASSMRSFPFPTAPVDNSGDSTPPKYC